MKAHKDLLEKEHLDRKHLEKQILLAHPEKNITSLFSKFNLTYDAQLSDLDLFFPLEDTSILHRILYKTYLHAHHRMDVNQLLAYAEMIRQQLSFLFHHADNKERLMHFLTYASPTDQHAIGHCIAAYARCGNSIFCAYLLLLQSPLLSKEERAAIFRQRNVANQSVLQVLVKRVPHIKHLRHTFEFVMTQLPEMDIVTFLLEPEGFGEAILKSREYPDLIHLLEFLMSDCLTSAAKEEILLSHTKHEQIVYCLYFAYLNHPHPTIDAYFKLIAQALFSADQSFLPDFEYHKRLGKGELTEEEWLRLLLSKNTLGSELAGKSYLHLLEKAHYSLHELLKLFSEKPAPDFSSMMLLEMNRKMHVSILLSFLMTTPLSKYHLKRFKNREIELVTYILHIPDLELKLKIVESALNKKHHLGSYFSRIHFKKSKTLKLLETAHAGILNGDTIQLTVDDSDSSEILILSDEGVEEEKLIQGVSAKRFSLFGSKDKLQKVAESAEENWHHDAAP